MNKHNSFEDFIGNFDVALIPEELYKILSECTVEFFTRSHNSNLVCKAAEISVITKDMRRRIFILFDYGYCMKFTEITINKFNTRSARDVEIVRLYKEVGLSQLFLAHIFKVSQPTISLIVNSK